MAEWVIVLILCLWGLLLSTASNGEQALPTAELDALQTLYSSTNGPEWNVKVCVRFHGGRPWELGFGACSWVGVTCATTSRSSAVVVGLNLSFCGLNGRIPSEIHQLTHLTIFDVGHNSLNSSIPNELFQLTDLIQLDFRNNSLTGTISADVGNLTVLRSLVLDRNQLTGTLPHSIGNLSTLNRLSFDWNSLSGTLPSELGYLQELSYFSCLNNSFVGSLPRSLGKLQSLLTFIADSNAFSGQLPIELANMTALRFFSAIQNRFTGTLLDSFGPNLWSLHLSLNRLRGPIPNVWNETMPSLKELYLKYNTLLGTIPASLCQLSLTHLDVFENQLEGALPSCLYPLVELSVGRNQLSGPIAAELLGPLSNLFYFGLSNNRFTYLPPIAAPKLAVLDASSNECRGQFRVSLSNDSLLAYVNIGSNQLSGSIPWTALPPKIEHLNTSLNQFSGSVDCSASFLLSLVSVDLSHNQFVGSVGNCFSLSHKLRILVLTNNQFNGNLNHLVNNITQTRLHLIDISSNQFSGSLPENIFHLPNLLTLAASANCLSNNLPSSVCVASELHNLLLDGIGSNPLCQNMHYLHLFRSVAISHWNIRTQPELPQCLFNASKRLERVYLSGLGLTGELPSTLPSSLLYLGLSHNLLSGTIPDVFFAQSWQSLDVSFNHISGVLQNFSLSTVDNVIHRENHRRRNETLLSDDDTGIGDDDIDIYDNANGGLNRNGTKLNGYGFSLNLQINLLSGKIPSRLLAYEDINILSGNLFSCPLDPRRDDMLPRNDPDSDAFRCGSNEIVAVLYSWLTLVSVMILIVIVLVRLCWADVRHAMTLIGDVMGKVAVKRFDEGSTAGPRSDENRLLREMYMTFVAFARYVLRRTLCLTIGILVVCLPVYVALKTQYRTYDLQELWEASALFLDGRQPAIAFFTIMSSIVIVFAITEGGGTGPLETDTTPSPSSSAKETMSSEEASLSEQARPLSLKTLVSSTADGSPPQLPSVVRPTVSSDRPTSLSRISSRFSKILQFSSAWTAEKRSLWWFAASCFVLLGLLLIVNVAYVYALQKSLHVTVTTVLMVIVSMSKFAFTSGCLWLADSVRESKRTVTILVSFLACSHILVPYLIEGLISVKCFYYAIVESSPQVQATVVSPFCTYFVNGGGNDLSNAHHYGLIRSRVPIIYLCVPRVQTATYVPSFVYSYDCSSTLITNFAPVFALRYTWSGVIAPAVQYLANHYLATTTEEAVASWPLWRQGLHNFLSSIPPRRWRLLQLSRHNAANASPITVAPLEMLMKEPITTLLNHQMIVSVFIQDLMSMLTFGLLFPPLAVLIAWSMCVQIVSEWVFVDALLQAVHDHPLRDLGDSVVGSSGGPEDVEAGAERPSISTRRVAHWQWQCTLRRQWLRLLRYEIDCLASRSTMLMQASFWTLVVLVWAFALFDTLGSTEGERHASVLAVIIIVVPSVVFFLRNLSVQLYHRVRQGQLRQSGRCTGDNDDTPVKETEMMATRQATTDTDDTDGGDGDEEGNDSGVVTKQRPSLQLSPASSPRGHESGRALSPLHALQQRRRTQLTVSSDAASIDIGCDNRPPLAAVTMENPLYMLSSRRLPSLPAEHTESIS